MPDLSMYRIVDGKSARDAMQGEPVAIAIGVTDEDGDRRVVVLRWPFLMTVAAAVGFAIIMMIRL